MKTKEMIKLILFALPISVTLIIGFGVDGIFLAIVTFLIVLCLGLFMVVGESRGGNRKFS